MIPSNQKENKPIKQSLKKASSIVFKSRIPIFEKKMEETDNKKQNKIINQDVIKH